MRPENQGPAGDGGPFFVAEARTARDTARRFKLPAAAVDPSVRRSLATVKNWAPDMPLFSASLQRRQP